MIDHFAELKKTLHVHVDDLPFVQSQPGLESRMIQFRPEDNFTVVELRAQPGAQSRPHRHTAPVLGWTIEGAWGHDHTYAYRPGSYIFETPGVVHQFLNGPDVTRALYISMGETEWMDPETNEVVGRSAQAGRLTRYLEACEAAGFPVPDVLR